MKSQNYRLSPLQYTECFKKVVFSGHLRDADYILYLKPLIIHNADLQQIKASLARLPPLRVLKAIVFRQF